MSGKNIKLFQLKNFIKTNLRITSKLVLFIGIFCLVVKKCMEFLLQLHGL